ncbi:MAG: hypothetical protein ACFFCO_09990 [Promethearchaeota archaeon]
MVTISPNRTGKEKPKPRPSWAEWLKSQDISLSRADDRCRARTYRVSAVGDQNFAGITGGGPYGASKVYPVASKAKRKSSCSPTD